MIFIIEGIPKYWFFNSKKEKDQMILKKNTSKLNFPCIVQTLGRITTDREKSDNLIYLKDFLSPIKHVKEMFSLIICIILFLRELLVCLSNSQIISKLCLLLEL